MNDQFGFSKKKLEFKIYDQRIYKLNVFSVNFIPCIDFRSFCVDQTRTDRWTVTVQAHWSPCVNVSIFVFLITPFQVCSTFCGRPFRNNRKIEFFSFSSSRSVMVAIKLSLQTQSIFNKISDKSRIFGAIFNCNDIVECVNSNNGPIWFLWYVNQNRIVLFAYNSYIIFDRIFSH